MEINLLPERTMNKLWQIDWERLFVPTDSVLEIVLRGTVMYLATFVLLRLFRRQTGSIGPADLLVLLFIADAAQNGMADDYQTVTEGLVLIGTIVFWEYLLDWLSFRFQWFQRLCEHQALQLVSRGQVDQSHLRGEMMTMDELTSQLRRKGIDNLDQVRACFLEGDGHISVLTWSKPDQLQDEDSQQADAH